MYIVMMHLFLAYGIFFYLIQLLFMRIKNNKQRAIEGENKSRCEQVLLVISDVF